MVRVTNIIVGTERKSALAVSKWRDYSDEADKEFGLYQRSPETNDEPLLGLLLVSHDNLLVRR
jgi:hypothetical protein